MYVYTCIFTSSPTINFVEGTNILIPVSFCLINPLPTKVAYMQLLNNARISQGCRFAT